MNPQAPPLPSLPSQKNKYQQAAFILGALFVIALVFGLWAFTSRSTIKKTADDKLTTTNTKLAQAQTDEMAAETTNKSPYKSFTGPATYGSVSFKYPKNWSAYIDQTDTNEPVDGYFYPDAVPGITSPTAFALRVELVNNDYSSVMDQFQGDINDGSVKVAAYTPPKMKGVANAQVGTMLSGTINTDSSGNAQKGEMVVLKVRDKTLQLYTESPNYLNDFDKIVLANLSYKP